MDEEMLFQRGREKACGEDGELGLGVGSSGAEDRKLGACSNDVQSELIHQCLRVLGVRGDEMLVLGPERHCALG